MGALPRGLLVLGVCAVLVAAVLADASPASSMVVGLAKCADCTRKNMKAEAAFTGLQVAVKCKNAHGEYETKAVGAVDKSGAFGVPLGADLLREDGELKQDCFAQLHSAPDHPCPGQEPSMIVRQSANGAEKKGFVAVPGEVHYSSQECASAFLCHFFHKKHLFHKKPALVVPHLNKKAIVIPHIHKKPIVIPHIHKKPIVIPHFHKKPAPVSVPEYKPPTPTPVYTHPKPVPEYKPPTPVYPHPAPIYHPPAADEKAALNPETDPQLFKKLLHKKPIVIPHLHKKPIVIPHFHKKPAPVPVPEYKPPTPTPVYKHPTPVPEYKPPTPVYPHPSPIYHPPAADQKTALNPETDPQLFKKLLHKKPIVIPHFHKKPVPVPEYKPPTPTPVYTHPTPVPEHKPPTPVYTHPTPIYHPPADQKMAQDPETDPQLFKKLLPFIKKNPFFKKFPPAKEDTKP
ncbi:proline-rich extensin-like protein EPR1 isoform X1 [Triticum urartu]|uniref:proline-rich extensin-like protein EPR1 isoform X1 n=1 Tax=Triticum urartu TaxID=4572 RepID=UPI00204384FB|nr:proline-rich extensin-like protein EPR1 isoform X1 [Triticum urartu]